MTKAYITIKNILLMSLGAVTCSVLFFSCFHQAPSYLSELSSESEEYDFRRSRLRTPLNVGRDANQCEDFRRCKNKCDQILDYVGERVQCYNLSLDTIGKIESTFSIFKEDVIKRKQLDTIRSRDFSLFVKIALRSWVKVIEGSYRESHDDEYDRRPSYQSNEAITVLKWIYDKEWPGDVMGGYTDAKEVLYQLLNHIVSSVDSCSGINFEGNQSSQNIGKVLCNHKNITGDHLLYSFSNLEKRRKKIYPAYTLLHEIAVDICERASAGGQSHNADKKCLNVLYGMNNSTTCPAKKFGYLNDLDDPDRYKYGVGRYLLSDQYNKTIPSNFCSSSFSDWSDYWNH